MNQSIKNLLKFLGFFGFGLFLLWLVYGYLNSAYLEHCEIEHIPKEDCSLIIRVGNDFKGASLIWVFMSVMFYMVSNIYRAFQWQILLQPISHKPSFGNSFWATMLGYFSNLGLPRMGEFIKSGALARNENIPFEKVFSSVVVSRILDMLFLGLTTLTAMILEFDKLFAFWRDIVGNYGLTTMYILSGGGFVVLALLIWITKAPQSSNLILSKIQNLVIGFKEGILAIKNIKRPYLLFFHTFMIWLMYILMTYVGFWSFAPTSSLSFSSGLVVFVIGALGFVVPSSGGMGTYHAMIIVALSLYGIDKFDSFSFAMILFITLQIGANILFGLLSLLALPRLRRT